MLITLAEKNKKKGEISGFNFFSDKRKVLLFYPL